MAFQRGSGNGGAKFSVGINVVLSGSKEMTDEQINNALPATGRVRIKIYAEDAPNLVLVDEVVEPREFSSGNAGYGLHTRGVGFEET